MRLLLALTFGIRRGPRCGGRARPCAAARRPAATGVGAPCGAPSTVPPVDPERPRARRVQSAQRPRSRLEEPGFGLVTPMRRCARRRRFGNANRQHGSGRRATWVRSSRYMGQVVTSFDAIANRQHGSGCAFNKRLMTTCSSLKGSHFPSMGPGRSSRISQLAPASSSLKCSETSAMTFAKSVGLRSSSMRPRLILETFKRFSIKPVMRSICLSARPSMAESLSRDISLNRPC